MTDRVVKLSKVLFRHFGNFLQCSCGPLDSISMDAILDQSVCSIINSLKNELYYITYKDNYPTTTTTTNTTISSDSLQYLGCVMTELLNYQEMVSLNITELGEMTVTGISPELCQGFCSSMPGQTR